MNPTSISPESLLELLKPICTKFQSRTNLGSVKSSKMANTQDTTWQGSNIDRTMTSWLFVIFVSFSQSVNPKPAPQTRQLSIKRSGLGVVRFHPRRAMLGLQPLGGLNFGGSLGGSSETIQPCKITHPAKKPNTGIPIYQTLDARSQTRIAWYPNSYKA